MSLQLPPGVSLDQVPTFPPPPGVQPLQLDAYPTWRNPVLLGVSITFSIIAGFFVFGRVYLNCSTKGRRLWWDDGFAVLGFLMELGFMGLRDHYRNYWRYLWDIPLSWFDSVYFKTDFTANMLLGPAQFFAKGSILLLYLRLFHPHRTTRFTLYILLALSFCLYFIQVPVHAYYCVPRHGAGWNIISATNCSKDILLGPTQGSFNVVLDIIILVLPVREVSKLNLSPRKKKLLFSVFASGFLAVVASIAGLAYRVEMFTEENKGYVTWYNYNTTMCIYLETYISLCCSSAPAFASLLQRRSPPASSPSPATLRSRILSLLRMGHQSSSAQSSPSDQEKQPAQQHPVQNSGRKFRMPGLSRTIERPYDSNGSSNMTGRAYWELDRSKDDESSLESSPKQSIVQTLDLDKSPC